MAVIVIKSLYFPQACHFFLLPIFLLMVGSKMPKTKRGPWDCFERQARRNMLGACIPLCDQMQRLGEQLPWGKSGGQQLSE